MLRRWLAVVLLLCSATVAEAAVTFDSAATSSAVSATSLNFNITIGAGSQKAVAVSLIFETATIPSGITVTVGGVSLSQVSGTVGAGLGNAIYAAPYTGATGVQTVAIAWTGAQTLTAGAWSVNGANQSTPVNNGSTSTGTVGPASLALTSTSGDLTFTMVDAINGVLSVTSNQTERWGPTTGSAVFAEGDTGPGTGSATHTWTLGANGSWAMTGANFVAAGSDTTPPSDPTGLQATANGSSQIDLSWTASTDNVAVLRYRIERCQGAGCVTFAEISTSSTTTYSDQGLNASTLYRYRVRAEDTSNNFSGYSAIAQATTGAGGDTQAPTQPSGFAAFVPGVNGIDLGWGASTDNVAVTGYRVERCTGSGCTSFAEVAQLDSSTRTYNDRGLSPATLYRYRVRALDAAINFSTYSSIVDATTKITTPTLFWTDNSSDETGFTISRRTPCNAGIYSDVATVAAGITQWHDFSPLDAAEAEYRVRAIKTGTADSENTNTVCFVKDRKTNLQFTGRDRTVPAVGLRQRQR